MLLHHTCDCVLSIVVNAIVFNADRTETGFPFCLFISIAAEGSDGQCIQYTQCGRGRLKWVNSIYAVVVSSYTMQTVHTM